MPSSHTEASNCIVYKQRNGSLPLLNGTHWVVWSELNDVKQLCIQAYKNAWHLPRSTASALFIFPKPHGSTDTGFIAACREMLATWRCGWKNPAGWLKPHFRRVVMRLFCWTTWGNGTVEVEWRNRRLLVETSKSIAAQQHLSHVGRAVGQKTRISAYHWKNELGCSN